MKVNEKLRIIEYNISVAKSYMGDIYWTETGIEGEEIEWLIKRIKKLESALDCVIDRHEKHGDDARKHGVSLGLYTVCKNALEEE